MSFGTRARWLLSALAALVLAGTLAFGAAVAVLRGKVTEAIGPSGETSAIRVGWSGVVLEGLRIPALPDWPSGAAAPDEAASGSPRLSLGEIALEDGVIEIFDASVAT